MRRELAIKNMDAIVAWLKANGIEPTDVPIDEVPRIIAGAISCRVFLRNEEGRKYLVDGEVATAQTSVPLRQAPPESLSEWLAS